MTIEKVMKWIRLGFAFLFGAALMTYAGYGWHMDWLNDWQALLAGTIGSAFTFAPHVLVSVLGKGIPKLFDATLGRFFGNGGSKASIIVILMLASVGAYAQGNKPVNTPEVRLLQKNDSTLISGVGQIRWDAVTGKFRFGDGTSWKSFMDASAGNFLKADGTTTPVGSMYWEGSTSSSLEMVLGDNTFNNEYTYLNANSGDFSVQVSDAAGTTQARVTLNANSDAELQLTANSKMHFNAPTEFSFNGQLMELGNGNTTTGTNRTLRAGGPLASNIDLTIEPKGTGRIKMPNLSLTTEPVNDDTETAVLVRDATTGDIEYRTAASLGGSYTAGAGLTLSGSEFSLGGTLTGGTLTQITSTSGNGLYVSMGSGVGTSTGSWQISPSFSVMKHQVGGGDLVQYIQQSGVGEFTGKHRLATAPTNDNASTKVLTRDATTGDIEQMDIVSGNWSSTYTGVTNVASFTNVISPQYTRVGNHATVAGGVSVTPTAGSTVTEIRVTLPVASNFLSNVEVIGTGTAEIVGGQFVPCTMYADTTNDEAVIKFYSSGTGGHIIRYQFMYRIQ